MAASYISVPRDLTKVKSKVMFNLTKRQLICFGMAALIGVPSFFLLKSVCAVNTAVMGMMVIMMPFFFLAMYEKNGQPLEVILSHMIQAIFIRPKIRPCVTKDMLKRTAREGFPRDYYSKCRARWDAMELESIVFGIKGVSYKAQVPVGDSVADICVYDGDNIALAIKLVVDGVYLPEEHRSEGYPYDEVEKLVSHCKTEFIPLFLVDYSELDDNEFDFGLSKGIKQAIGDVEFCNKHNEERRIYIREDWAIYDEDIETEINEDSYIIKEPIFKLFEGQIKGMKLVSNRLCFGPQPKPMDEIEQHLSIYNDGRVFFSGYLFGDVYDFKYKKSRSKRFKVGALEAAYVLNHIAMLFSKDFPIDLVTDVGEWTLELINTDGESFRYYGALFADLQIDGVGLSYLIRKYLGMSDLFAFDGDARLPIMKEEEEYIFVNVFFEGGGKTYCYLCDDDLIKDGDEVLVPVGRDGELKSVLVDSVELHTAKDAPFPIDKCKKVVRRITMTDEEKYLRLDVPEPKVIGSKEVSEEEKKKREEDFLKFINQMKRQSGKE